MTRKGEYFNADDSTNPGWNRFPDDELREEYDGQYDGQWIHFHDRAWRSQRVKAPMGNIIAAVLAEIVRQDAEGSAVYDHSVPREIYEAAFYIRSAIAHREAMRLAPPSPTRNDGGTTDGN